jgi:DHA2 family multidrug resistance protein
MATIAQERMGYATSMFNLMRNIGGSIGIAITATILQRQRVQIGSHMGENVSVYDTTTQTLLAQITNGLVAAGSDAVTATQRAYMILNGMLFRQASMVSFVYLFRLLGIVFLLMVPLVFIMRRPKRGGGGGAAAAH